MDKAELLKGIADAVIVGKAPDTEAGCKEGLEAGVPAAELLNGALLVGMTDVGEKFRVGEYFIPEMLVAARAMKAGVKVLEPELAKGPKTTVGTVVIGTVSGDLHDIGKNLAGIMLGAAGFEVVDLGIDVSAEKFVEGAKQAGAEAVGLSALLTTTMVNMEGIVKSLREAGFDGKVIIGGAPVTQEFAEKIGADFYAADAAEGAEKLKKAVTAA